MPVFTPTYADPGQSLTLRISAVPSSVSANTNGFTFRRYSDRNIIEIDVTGTPQQLSASEWEVPITVRPTAQSGLCEVLWLSPQTPGGLAIFGAFWIRPAWAIATQITATPNEIVPGTTIDVRVSGVPPQAPRPSFIFYENDLDYWSDPHPSIRVLGHPVNEGGGTFRIKVEANANAQPSNCLLKMWLTGNIYINKTNFEIETASTSSTIIANVASVMPSHGQAGQTVTLTTRHLLSPVYGRPIIVLRPNPAVPLGSGLGTPSNPHTIREPGITVDAATVIGLATGDIRFEANIGPTVSPGPKWFYAGTDASAVFLGTYIVDQPTSYAFVSASSSPRFTGRLSLTTRAAASTTSVTPSSSSPSGGSISGVASSTAAGGATATSSSSTTSSTGGTTTTTPAATTTGAGAVPGISALVLRILTAETKILEAIANQATTCVHDPKWLKAAARKECCAAKVIKSVASLSSCSMGTTTPALPAPTSGGGTGTTTGSTPAAPSSGGGGGGTLSGGGPPVEEQPPSGNPPQLSLTSKYRRVDIHGVPMPDPSPTGEAESDRAVDLGHVDMYSLTPNFSSVDATMPVEGGELSVQFKRSTGIRSRGVSAVASKRPITWGSDHLLGLGWDNNLACRIIVKKKTTGNQNLTVNVVDEIGNNFSYVPFGTEFRANTYHSFANDAIRARLRMIGPDTFELQRVFGTRLFYKKAKQKVNPATMQQEEYYLLMNITDRNGNSIIYEYDHNYFPDRDGDLLVTSIYERAHPERRLTFNYRDEGQDIRSGDKGLRLESVVDPLGHTTQYIYAHQGSGIDHVHAMLAEVKREQVLDASIEPPTAARPSSRFEYYIERLPTDDPHVQNLFVAPSSIENARSHQTRFTYVTEQFPVAIGRVQVYFQQRPRVASISSMDGTALVDTLIRSVERVHTRATDTSGAVVEYDFLASREPANNELGAAVFVTKLIRTTLGIGHAEFDWAADPNNNLINVLDMNALEQKFDYQGHGVNDPFADPIDPQRPYNAIENPNRYQAFNLPSKRTILGSTENLESTWQYETQFNKKIREVDAEGMATICHIDGAGNRYQVDQTMGRSCTSTFDPDGFISEQVDEDGRITRFERLFNPAELERYVTLRTEVVGYPGPSGAGTLNLVSVSEIDILGNTRSEIDPLGFVTTTHYDKLLRVTEKHHPPVEDPNDPNGPLVSGIEHRAYDLNSNVVKQTDENDNVTRYEYDLLNRKILTRVRMANANQDDASDIISKISYDERGLVDYTTDPQGNSTGFEYDIMLRKVREYPPILQSSSRVTSQHVVHYEYGAMSGAGSFLYALGWTPTRILNARGYASDTVFDEFYRNIREVRRIDNGATISHGAPPRPAEPTTETQYNKVHKMIHERILAEDAFGNDRSKNTYFFYDEGHRKTLEVVDVDGNGIGLATGSVVNDAWSVNLSANSDASRQSYDGASHVIRESDAEGRTTDMVYDGAGRQTALIEPELEVFDPTGYNPNGFMRPTHKVHFDPRGHTEMTEDPNHNRIRMERDARGRIIRTILDMGDGQFNDQFGGPDIVSQVKWDIAGNEIALIDSMGNVIEKKYDAANRLTHTIMPEVDLVGGGTAIPIEKTSYDFNSNIVDETDAEGISTHKDYDAWDRCVKTTMASGTPNALQSESFYDANNNPMEYRLHNGAELQRTRCEYDAFDRKTREICPPVSDGLVREAHTKYYRDNLVARSIDPNGQQFAYNYDRKARVKSLELRRHNGSIEERREFSYSAVDMTLSVTDGAGKTERFYDAHDRLIGEQRSQGARSRLVKVDRDAVGNPTRLRYPDTGRELITKYDRNNRMVELDDSLSGVTAFQYDANSNRIACQTPNQLNTSYQYDRLDRLFKLDAEHANGPVYSAKFGFDQVGNRLQIKETTAGQSQLLSYQYNELYRLEVENLGADEIRYAYDPAGNRIEQIQNLSGNSATTTYNHDALNRLLSIEQGSDQTTYRYDLNGNLIELHLPNGTIVGYTWDVADRLIAADVDGDGINEFSAIYDYRSRREATVEPGDKREYHYFEGDCIQEFEDQNLVVEFVMGPGLGGGIGGIIYGDRRPGGGNEETFTYNSVGHTMAVTGSTGNLLAAYRYFAFGEHLVLNGASPNDRLANTRQHSTTLGLDNHGHRYYDPANGRYISQDPNGLADGLNLYSYSHNNPVNGFDPTGLGGYGIGEWLWDIVTDSSIRNASASGFAEGAKGGGSILVNEYSGGLSDKFGVTNSEQYQGAAYDAARVTATISKEALMAAGGGGPKLLVKAVSTLNKLDKVSETIQKGETIVQINASLSSGNLTGALTQAGTSALGAGAGFFGGRRRRGRRRKDRGTDKTTDTGAERRPEHVEKEFTQDEVDLLRQREPDMPGPDGGFSSQAVGQRRGQHRYHHNKKRDGVPGQRNPEGIEVAHSDNDIGRIDDRTKENHAKMTRAANQDPSSYDTWVSEGPPGGFAEGKRQGKFKK
jgi:RHS repeat-associated protein